MSPTANLELFFSRCNSTKRLSFSSAITTSLGVELIISSWFTRLIFNIYSGCGRSRRLVALKKPGLWQAARLSLSRIQICAFTGILQVRLHEQFSGKQYLISSYDGSCAGASCACALPFYVSFFSFRLASFCDLNW